MEEIANRNPAIRKAISIEEIIKKDANERRLYLLQEKARMGLESSLKGAEARGEPRGREEGIEVGIIKTARNMLKSGLNKPLIQQITGLSQEVIEQLARNHEGGS